MPERWTELSKSAVLIIVTVLAAWLAPGSTFFALAVVFALLYHAQTLGSRLFPSLPLPLAFSSGLLTLLAGQSAAQTAWYYAGGRLGSESDVSALAFAILLLELVTWRTPRAPDGPPPLAPTIAFHWLALYALPAIVGTGFVLRHAWLAATADAIRSPWPLLPAGTIAALVLVALSAWLAAARIRRAGVIVPFASLALASVFLIVPLLYSLGYGFDGFLHRESERLIATSGTLDPKPPYYLGQYVFVTWLVRLLHLPLRELDILLVPIAAAVLLPLGAWIAWNKRPSAAWTVAALPFLLPLEPFIASTPQSFSYVLGFFAVLLAIGRGAAAVHVAAPLLLALWSLAAHPLAGLPFAGAVVTLVWMERRQGRERSPWPSPLTWIFILATSLSVPLAFLVHSRWSGAQIDWQFARLTDWRTYLEALKSVLAAPAVHVSLWADWAAQAAYAFPFVLILLAAFARYKNEDRRHLWIALWLLALGTFAAGWALSVSGEFTFLIDYERGNYASRLFLVADFLLLPPAIAGLASLAERLRGASATSAVAFLLLLAAWQGAHAYAALPRHDAAVIGHGWSAGRADISAVHFIDEDAGGRAYTVLANQSVSAVAVEAFGFRRYTPDGNFYYPIPTGGKLYQLFLKATGAHPSRDVIREAAVLGRSDLVYVVLNDYWWDADRVAEDLSAIADRERAFDGKKVIIYRFDFSKDKNR